MQGKTGEQATKESYDFDFITRSLAGLMPIQENTSAINPAMIAHVDRDRTDGNTIITMHNGMKYHMTPAHMIELEINIKRRLEDQKILQKESIKDQMRMQAEAVAELNASVTPGRIAAPWQKRRQ